MHWFRVMALRIRGLVRREAIADDIDAELNAHLEIAAAAHVARGMTPEEARRRARARLGDPVRAREQGLDVRGGGWLDILWQDTRYGWRMLVGRPGFAIAAIATLALGIGATTAVFGVVNGVLLRPLPYAEPGRLDRIVQESGPGYLFGMSVADYLGLEELYRVGRVAATDAREVTLSDGRSPEFVRAAFASAGFFDLLGIRPALGRAYLPGEDRPGGSRVALISHGLWQRRFGASPEALGRSVTLDGESYSIVGVLPADFVSPMGGPADVWPVLELKTPPRRGPFFLRVIARRDPGVTPERSSTALAAVAREVHKRWSTGPSGSASTFRAMPLEEAVIGDIRPTLLVLLGAIAFVLLIASVNVANLLLARAVARQEEMAMRAALGASRGRLVRQLLTEGALLAAAGGAAGVGLAWWALEALLALAPENIPRLDQVWIDARVLGFALGCTAVSTIVMSLLPAFHGVRRDLAGSLRGGGRGNAGAPGHGRLRDALVVAEIALALPLLVGAGLMLHSFVRLNRVDPGFAPERLLTLSLSLPPARYPGNDQVARAYDDLLARVRALPGVRSAAVTSNLPLDRNWGSNDFNLERRPNPPGEAAPAAEYSQVSPGYFETLRIPLVSGRGFTEADAGEKPLVMLISEAAARRHFPGESPIGMRLKTGGCDECPWTTIVGVVGDVKDHELGHEAGPAMYVPFLQEAGREMFLVMRSDLEPEALVAAVRREVQGFDPELALSDVGTMEDLVALSTGPSRYRMTLLGAFAGTALLLTAVGIYGVTAYAVSRRTREFGIRIALGAGRAAIVRMVLRHGMGACLVGVVIGLAASLGLARLVASLLYGVEGTDPATLAAVVFVLMGVALCACLVPARRATRVDPLVALRSD